MLNRIRDWLKPEREGPQDPDHHPTGIVLTVPPDQGISLESVPGARRTEEVFRDLIMGAKEIVKVFSPYVDPTFTGLASAAVVPVRIVTTVRDGKIKSNPVLERCAMARPIAVRYLHERRGGSQLLQLHAKMVLCDHRAAYVGSANFTDTSLRYNLELGMFVEDRRILDELHRLFDAVFERLATPARA